MQQQAHFQVIIVDDEPHNISLLRGFLRNMDVNVTGAVDAASALDIVNRSTDLVLADVMMPSIDGFEMVRRIRANPETESVPIIMVTTLDAKEDRLKAVEAGANDFITKPVDALELEVKVRSMLRIRAQQREIESFEAELSALVNERTAALRHTLRKLDKAYADTVHHLCAAAEYKDDDTGEHIKRMSHYCALLAGKMGLDAEQVKLILRSSPMHDIGKIGIPDSILFKPGPLDPSEWRIMQTHTTIGAEILGTTDSDYLNMGSIIALSHHEKWDGSGYPSGLSGEDIPLPGRICAVADVFDALMSKRPYKEAFPLDRTLDIMVDGRGRHFDPEVLDLFLESIDEVMAIREGSLTGKDIETPT